MIRSSLICLVALGTLTLAGCGQAAFSEFSSAEGKFKVQMPGTPKQQTQAAAGTNLKNFSVETRSGAYMVSFADMPIPANESAKEIQQRLDGARDGMVRNVNGTLTNSSNITLGKYPGRDVQASLPNNKGQIHAKVYLVNTRLYQVMVVGTSSFINSADASKFLNSFELTQ